MDEPVWEIDGEPEESVKKKRKKLSAPPAPPIPPIPVVLTPGDRVHTWGPQGGRSRRAHLGDKLKVDSGTTPNNRQHLRVQVEKTVPRSQGSRRAERQPRPGVLRCETCSATSGSRRVQRSPCPSVVCSRMVRMESRSNRFLWTPLMM